MHQPSGVPRVQEPSAQFEALAQQLSFEGCGRHLGDILAVVENCGYPDFADRVRQVEPVNGQDQITLGLAYLVYVLHNSPTTAFNSLVSYVGAPSSDSRSDGSSRDDEARVLAQHLGAILDHAGRNFSASALYRPRPQGHDPIEIFVAIDSAWSQHSMGRQDLATPLRLTPDKETKICGAIREFNRSHADDLEMAEFGRRVMRAMEVYPYLNSTNSRVARQLIESAESYCVKHFPSSAAQFHRMGIEDLIDRQVDLWRAWLDLSQASKS